MKAKTKNQNSKLLDTEKKYRIEINNKRKKSLFTLAEIKAIINKNKDKNIMVIIHELPYLPLREEQPFLFNNF
jgi:hypothetical protein